MESRQENRSMTLMGELDDKKNSATGAVFFS
jgi:hypothetical protein